LKPSLWISLWSQFLASKRKGSPEHGLALRDTKLQRKPAPFLGNRLPLQTCDSLPEETFDRLPSFSSDLCFFPDAFLSQEKGKNMVNHKTRFIATFRAQQ
jgi:hypothetical protein